MSSPKESFSLASTNGANNHDESEAQTALLGEEQHNPTNNAPTRAPHDEEDEEDSLEYQSDTVLTIMKPVSITMLIVVWAVRTITLPGRGTVSYYMAFEENESDGTGTRLFHSLINALMFLVAILVTTVLFVILYKYRCLKVIYGWLITSSFIIIAAFGGYFFYLLLQAYNLPLDMVSFFFLIWNFGVVGIIAIFWHGPTRINQGYLVLISAFLAIFFTRLPEWTTFAILAVVAIYDLFAVLCPKGPLKVLVETAQKRQEPIPALLYNASVFIMMANKDEEKAPEPPKPKRKGVKLGLGDFVFYSVLIGRAALYDMITVFSCFVAIITGLFFTLLLLAIFRKALPALPLSIAFGLIFYFLTRVFLLPFVITIGSNQIFV